MAKKSEDKKKEAKVDTVPMTQILDDLLKKGGTLQELTETAKKEQEARGGNRYRSTAGIIAHMKARATAKNPLKYNVDVSKEIQEDTFIQSVE
jgi:hypothetical protein